MIETIQLHILNKILIDPRRRQILRLDVIKELKVTAKMVEEAVAQCDHLKRVASNGGHHIRYGLADLVKAE